MSKLSSIFIDSFLPMLIDLTRSLGGSSTVVIKRCRYGNCSVIAEEPPLAPSLVSKMLLFPASSGNRHNNLSVKK